MLISLELVPREKNTFEQEIQWTKKHISSITHINIPDLTRLPTRSWEASLWVGKNFPVIAHVRACDVKYFEIETFYQTLTQHGISDILVIQGDQETKENQGMSSVEMITLFRQLDKNLVVYAAIDPYRQSLAKEMLYAEQKLKAGANGFLTQPFFEKTLLEKYMQACQGLFVWWGVSPILSEKSLSYWREKNGVPIPEGYDISLDGNVAWGRFVLERVSQHKHYALYLMPIRVDIQVYLPPLFENLF